MIFMKLYQMSNNIFVGSKVSFVMYISIIISVSWLYIFINKNCSTINECFLHDEWGFVLTFIDLSGVVSERSFALPCKYEWGFV